jgi:hypothetical protein
VPQAGVELKFGHELGQYFVGSTCHRLWPSETRPYADNWPAFFVWFDKLAHDKLISS